MYKPLNSGKPNKVQWALFEDRGLLCLFPLSEAAFMVGFVGMAHSLTNLLVSIFDIFIGGARESSSGVLVCAYYTILCLGYISGCVGSSLFDRRLIGVMRVFMLLDVAITAGLAVATASNAKHSLSSLHFNLWVFYRALGILVNVYALLKISKQITLMELLGESDAPATPILRSSRLKDRNDFEKA